VRHGAQAEPRRGDPTVVLCMDEFGPLNLFPRPGDMRDPIVEPNGDLPRQGDSSVSELPI
jgi:hypothetical protein